MTYIVDPTLNLVHVIGVRAQSTGVYRCSVNIEHTEDGLQRFRCSMGQFEQKPHEGLFNGLVGHVILNHETFGVDKSAYTSVVHESKNYLVLYRDGDAIAGFVIEAGLAWHMTAEEVAALPVAQTAPQQPNPEERQANRPAVVTNSMRDVVIMIRVDGDGRRLYGLSQCEGVIDFAASADVPELDPLCTKIAEAVSLKVGYEVRPPELHHVRDFGPRDAVSGFIGLFLLPTRVTRDHLWLTWSELRDAAHSQRMVTALRHILVSYPTLAEVHDRLTAIFDGALIEAHSRNCHVISMPPSRFFDLLKKHSNSSAFAVGPFVPTTSRVTIHVVAGFEYIVDVPPIATTAVSPVPFVHGTVAASLSYSIAQGIAEVVRRLGVPIVVSGVLPTSRVLERGTMAYPMLISPNAEQRLIGPAGPAYTYWRTGPCVPVRTSAESVLVTRANRFRAQVRIVYTMRGFSEAEGYI